MVLAVYLHNLNPVAIPIWGNLAIRWYGLSYIAGFIAAYSLLHQLAKRGKILLQPQQVGDFIVALAFGTVLGGRLGYALFYRSELLTDFRPSFPFWGLLAINEGGMASHGGIIGLVLACIFFARKLKPHPPSPIPHPPASLSLHLFDLVALTGPLGMFFGRIANFVNGELYGRTCSDSLPWAVKFPQELRDWSGKQLRPVVEALESLGLRDPDTGNLVERAIHMVQQGNAQVIEALAPLLPARHPSQLYAALLEGAFMFVVLWAVWRKPRRPGVVAGWFLALYPVVRIVVEQFRTPDAHIGYQALGLTRGQWISLFMLALGGVCLVWWSRRNVPPLGGWKRFTTEVTENTEERRIEN